MGELSNMLDDAVQLTDLEFHRFRDYLDASVEMFKKKIDEAVANLTTTKAELSKLLKAHDGNIDPDTVAFSKWEELITDEYLQELELKAHTEMRTVFTHSSFIFAISVFETSLRRLCEIFVDETKLKPDQVRERNIIGQMKLFLSKVVGMDVPPQEEWDYFKTYFSIRNLLVHSNGRVDRQPGKPIGNQSDHYKAVHQFGHLMTMEETEDRLCFSIREMEFIHEFFEKAQDFLLQLSIKARSYVSARGL